MIIYFGLDNLKSNIYKERNCSAYYPGADHKTYADQDHDRWESFCKFRNDLIFNIFPCVSLIHAHTDCKCCTDDQKDFDINAVNYQSRKEDNKHKNQWQYCREKRWFLDFFLLCFHESSPL